MSIIGGKSIEHNTSIIGTNCQHNQQNLHKTHALHRIARFQSICGNDFVKLKLQMKQKGISSVDTYMYLYELLNVCWTVEELTRQNCIASI